MLAILRRLGQMVALLALLSVVLFGLLSAMPGDPVDLLVTSNPRIKPEDIVRLKKLRGLDQPWYVQYARWIWGHHAPRRPPAVDAIEAVVTALDDDGVAEIEVDLAPHVRDPDHPDHRALLGEALAAAGIPLSPAPAGEDPTDEERDAVGDAFARLSVKAQRAIERDVRAREAARLTLRGLFGTTVDGTTLRARLETPGLFRLWFTVTDSDGYTSVGSVPVAVAPPAPPAGPSVDEDAAVQEAMREESPQLAGSTEVPEAAPRTREALLAAAERAQRGPVVQPIADPVVDDPATFRVDLSGLDATGGGGLTFTLRGPGGAISSAGFYTNRFAGPGKTVVTLDVENAEGSAPAAFAVEHGPIPDPDAFRPGFLFALLGDKEALGFSNTYKRPVWELLAGATIVCGDGEVGPGESCDDGNTASGDGCSATCQDERLSFFDRLDVVMAGHLLNSGRILNTLFLMFPALLLSFLIAIPIGVLAAYRQYSWVDYVVNFFAFIGISLPVFWFGIMLLALFAEQLKWLPAGGIQTPGLRGGFLEVLLDRLRYAILPASVLAIAYAGRWLRYMRASMLEVLPLDYIRTARAKGLSERVVVLRHALRNALIPVVTVLALSVPTLFGGALLTEQVFSWPGIGRLQFETVMSNDYYVAIVVFLISAALVMLGNLLADVAYLLVDPRIRRR